VGARAATVLADGTGAVADAVVARWFTPAFADGFPALVREMRDTIASTPPDGYAARAAASSNGPTSARACIRSKLRPS
jgi:hypothetical protein